MITDRGVDAIINDTIVGFGEFGGFSMEYRLSDSS